MSDVCVPVCGPASGDLSRLRLAQAWEPEQRAAAVGLAAARLETASLSCSSREAGHVHEGKMSFIPTEEMRTPLFSQHLAALSS